LSSQMFRFCVDIERTPFPYNQLQAIKAVVYSSLVGVKSQ
jgi:hypothetical protein